MWINFPRVRRVAGRGQVKVSFALRVAQTADPDSVCPQCAHPRIPASCAHFAARKAYSQGVWASRNVVRRLGAFGEVRPGIATDDADSRDFGSRPAASPTCAAHLLMCGHPSNANAGSVERRLSSGEPNLTDRAHSIETVVCDVYAVPQRSAGHASPQSTRRHLWEDPAVLPGRKSSVCFGRNPKPRATTVFTRFRECRGGLADVADGSGGVMPCPESVREVSTQLSRSGEAKLTGMVCAASRLPGKPRPVRDV